MRDINLLHPKIKEKALKLQQLAKDKLGLRIIITQTLRTEYEQAALYAQGRKTLAEVNQMRKVANLAPISPKENKYPVTKAATVAASYHGYGLAFDIAITDSTGKEIGWNGSDFNSDKVDDWDQVGKLADEVGLEWGGNFTSICDKPHYQDRLGFTIARLRSEGYKPGEVIKV